MADNATPARLPETGLGSPLPSPGHPPSRRLELLVTPPVDKLVLWTAFMNSAPGSDVFLANLVRVKTEITPDEMFAIAPQMWPHCGDIHRSSAVIYFPGLAPLEKELVEKRAAAHLAHAARPPVAREKEQTPEDKVRKLLKDLKFEAWKPATQPDPFVWLEQECKKAANISYLQERRALMLGEVLFKHALSVHSHEELWTKNPHETEQDIKKICQSLRALHGDKPVIAATESLRALLHLPFAQDRNTDPTHLFKTINEKFEGATGLSYDRLRSAIETKNMDDLLKAAAASDTMLATLFRDALGKELREKVNLSHEVTGADGALAHHSHTLRELLVLANTKKSELARVGGSYGANAIGTGEKIPPIDVSTPCSCGRWHATADWFCREEGHKISPKEWLEGATGRRLPYCSECRGMHVVVYCPKVRGKDKSSREQNAARGHDKGGRNNRHGAHENYRSHGRERSRSPERHDRGQRDNSTHGNRGGGKHLRRYPLSVGAIKRVREEPRAKFDAADLCDFPELVSDSDEEGTSESGRDEGTYESADVQPEREPINVDEAETRSPEDPPAKWIVVTSFARRGDETVDGNVDSGADVCCANIDRISRIWPDILANNAFRNVRAEPIRDAQGRAFPRSIELYPEWNIRGHIVRHRVFAVEGLAEDLLIGRDFIEKYMTNIDPQAGTAVLFGETISLRNPHMATMMPYGRTAETVTIPAGKRTILTIKVDDSSAFKRDVFVRPSGRSEVRFSNLIWSEELQPKSANGEYKITVHNPGKEEVVIPKLFPAATIEAVTVDREKLDLAQLPSRTITFVRDLPFAEGLQPKANQSKNPIGIDLYSMNVKTITPVYSVPEGRQLPIDRLNELRTALDAHRTTQRPTNPPPGKFAQSRKGRHVLVIEHLNRAIQVSDPVRAVHEMRKEYPIASFLHFHVGTPAQCGIRKLSRSEIQKLASVNTVTASAPRATSGLAPDRAAEAENGQTRGARPVDQMDDTGPDEEIVGNDPDVPWKTSKKLSAEDRAKIIGVLNEFKQCVPADIQMGKANYPPIDITLKEGAVAVHARARRVPQALIHDLIKHLEEGLRNGTYTRSVSRWASPMVVMRKPDGSLRVCIDYTQVNNATIPEQSAMPIGQEAWDQLKHKKYFSLIDLKSGYMQFKLTDKASEIGAFLAPPPFGLMQPLVLKEGFRNAPAVFQKAMWTFFGHLPFVFIYLDDILVASDTIEEHVEHLRKVLTIFREKNLFIHIKKSSFGKQVIKHLGHIIGNGVVRPDPKKVDAIRKAQPPKDVKGLQRFLGMANFYRRFLGAQVATLSESLNGLLRKSAHWRWNETEQKSFEAIKECLASNLVLHMPDWAKPFGMKTDASNVGIGAVIYQEEVVNGEKMECPISFFSRALSPAERNYSTTDRELLAIVEAVEHFRYYLFGRQATIWTDHEALKYIRSAPPEQVGRNGRWLRKLSEYDILFQYIKGKDNVVADALSREPIISDVEIKDISAKREKMTNDRREHQFAINQIRQVATVTRARADPKRDRVDYKALNKGAPVDLGKSDSGKHKRKKAAEHKGPAKASRKENDSDEIRLADESADVLLADAPPAPPTNAELRPRSDEAVSDVESSKPEAESHYVPDLTPLAMKLARHEAEAAARRGKTSTPPAEWAFPEVEKYIREKLVHAQDAEVMPDAPEQPSALLKLVAEAQKRDPRTQKLLTSLRSTEKGRKTYRGDKFVEKDGLLCRLVHIAARGQYAHALVVPFEARDLVRTVLFECHDTSLAGHQGVTKTLTRVKPMFWWRNMEADVREYCRRCKACGAGKTPKHKPNGLMTLVTPPSSPFEEVGVDFIGPLPESGPEGYRYVVVLTCLFSGSVIAWPARTCKAAPFAREFVLRVVLEGKTPRALRHDRGTSFENALVKALLRNLEIANLSSSGYRPQFNALTERCNGMFAQMMRTVPEVQRNNWHMLVPIFVAVLRSRIDATRNESPFFIEHGWDFRTPLSVAAGVHTTGPMRDPATFALDTFVQMQDVYKEIRERITDSKEVAKEHYDKSRVDVEFEPSQLVWLYTPSIEHAKTSKSKQNQPRQFNAKYMPQWVGPYRVVSRHGPVNYELINQTTGVKLEVKPHVQRLKPYFATDSRPRDTPPLVVDDEFEFENEPIRARATLLAPGEPTAQPLVSVDPRDTRKVPEDLFLAAELAGINVRKVGSLGTLFSALHHEYVKAFAAKKKKWSNDGKQKLLNQKQLRPTLRAVLDAFLAQERSWYGSQERLCEWVTTILELKKHNPVELWLRTLLLDFRKCLQTELESQSWYAGPLPRH